MNRPFPSIDLRVLAILALLLALAPFAPEPHLWEKLKMLRAGTLSRPLDIFDLLMHASGLLGTAVVGLARLRHRHSLQSAHAPKPDPDTPGT